MELEFGALDDYAFGAEHAPQFCQRTLDGSGHEMHGL
jgi:hypothetical protein